MREQLITSYTHDWRSDPFSRGAYSYLPVNGVELQQTLALPVDETLYFAGEATSVGHIGTVHGAIDSGHVTARRFWEKSDGAWNQLLGVRRPGAALVQAGLPRGFAQELLA